MSENTKERRVSQRRIKDSPHGCGSAYYVKRAPERRSTAEQEATSKHFNVTVRYHDGKQEREMRFIMESESVHTAMRDAPAIAETVSMFGPKWTSFETTKASPVKFPYMLGDTEIKRKSEK